ncbi:Hypothetical predicted protein, partial [Cloeon dipterum]
MDLKSRCPKRIVSTSPTTLKTFFKVQQAKVEVSGLLVNVSSAEWVPVEAFSLEGAKKNVDFHQMGFFDRAFDLDVLVAPPGYVLTGIRFRRIGTHLNPEIRVTPIDLRQ